MNYLNNITNLLKNIDTANVTLAIVVMVMVIFFTGLIIRFLSKFKGEPIIPSMLSSLGILGTFTGITIGLLNFDTTDIENSVPLLLGGLQSAFITSLAGMGFSILYKIICVTVLKNTQFIEEDTSGSEVESLAQRLDKLIDQSDEVNINLNNMGDSVDNVVNGVKDVVKAVNTHDSATKTYDKVKIGLMKETNAILNKGPGEEMVDAFATVAEKFNDVLENQIGRSFEKLNNGVTNLLEWQEQHKSNITALNLMNTTLETLPSKLTETVSLSSDIMTTVNDSIIKSEQSLDMHKEASSVRIISLDDSLTTMINKATSNMEQANMNITTAIKHTADNVDNLVTATATHVDDLVTATTSDITRATNEATTAINKVTTEAADAIIRNMEDNDGLKKLQKQLTASIDDAINQSNDMAENTKQTNTQIAENTKQTNTQLAEMKREQNVMLEEFRQDVQKTVNVMSQQMASLVKHIVDTTTKGKTNV